MAVSAVANAGEVSELTCPELEVELWNTNDKIKELTQSISETETQLRHSNPYGQLNETAASVNECFANGKINSMQRKRRKLNKRVAEIREARLISCSATETTVAPAQAEIDPAVAAWAQSSSYFNKDPLKTSVAIAEMDNLMTQYPNTSQSVLLPLLDDKMKKLFPDIED